MKSYYTLFLPLLLVVLLSACSNALDKKVDIDNYETITSDYHRVVAILDNTDTLPAAKKDYIKENLYSYVEFAQVLKQIKETVGEGMGQTSTIGQVPTFRQQIASLGDEFDKRVETENLAEKKHSADNAKISLP